MNAELWQTIRRLGYFALIFAAGIVIIAAVEKKQSTGAEGIEINVTPLPDGHFLVDSMDIAKTIKRSFAFEWSGHQIGLLNTERLERVLEDDPFILNADVYVNARNMIYIMVQQREPVLRIIDDNGLQYYIDKDGNKMPLSKHFSARVMVATGNLPPHVPGFLDRENHLLKDVFMLSQYIEADRFLHTLVEQIYVSNGKIWLSPKVGNYKIILGDVEGMEEKFERLKVFYQEVMPYKGWRRYKIVNLSFKGQIVCQKR